MYAIIIHIIRMIYLIITTCINNKFGDLNIDHRKERYLLCIQTILDLLKDNTSIKPIIVENNGMRHTYLNDVSCDVVYTNNNMTRCRHKGVNELLDIKHVLDSYSIEDDDTIIKLTGRYKLLDNSFLQLVMEQCSTKDAFVKFFNVCTKQFMSNDCVLGLFALKCKYLKQFNYVSTVQSPEVEFATFVRKVIEKEKIVEVDDLKLECCFADDLRLLSV